RTSAVSPSSHFPAMTISRGRSVDRPVASFSPAEERPADEKTALMLILRDLWLPLALAILMTALVLGLQVLGTDVVWLDACLLIGLPGAICYTFIGRPIRFALGIAAILLVGRFGRDVLHSRVVRSEEHTSELQS